MQKLAFIPIWFLPFVFSLSFHEFSHAWMANRLGDNTAKFMGRVSMNPKVHVDVIGTILFPLISFFTGFPLIGWAKPVPVNERNFKDKYRDGMIVSAAGPYRICSWPFVLQDSPFQFIKLQVKPQMVGTIHYL